MTEDTQPEDILESDALDDGEPDEEARLREVLEETEREREQFKALALRYRADLENYKKRSAQDMEDVRERANSQLLMKLIGVADDFNRALDHIPADSAANDWVEGLRHIERSVQNVMDSEGLSRIEAVIGQPFDVYEHEAVFFEQTDEVAEGAVVRVVRDGYRLKNRVLRATQVSVAQPPAQQDTEPETQNEEAQ